MVVVDTHIHEHSLNERDTIMTNAKRLAAYGGGGTRLGAALAHLNATKETGDLIILVSDNESWLGGERPHYSLSQGTEMVREFNRYQRRNANAKLVCIDIAPTTTAQAPDSDICLNIGGFSDAVWSTIARFVEGDTEDKTDSSAWVDEIEAIELPSPRTGV